MKSLNKVLIILLFVSVLDSVAKAEALSILPESNMKYSNLKLEFWTAGLNILTDKFWNFGGASVKFGPELVELTIENRGPKCEDGQMCPMLIALPRVISLKVVSYRKLSCSDMYIAQTSGKSKDTFEQIIIEDNSVGRCETLVAVPDGKLEYRIAKYVASQEKHHIERAVFSLKNVVEISENPTY